jgi:DNA-binding NarL/FixJ family response regulator
MIRILIADDHHLVRQGIRALLQQSDGVEIVAEAATGQEALELAQRFEPDVLLMDINMPRLNGIQATERLQSLHLKTQVVMLSAYSDDALVRQAMQSGARGYLLKSSVAAELMLAIAAAARGEVYLSPTVAGPLLTQALRTVADSEETRLFELLSPREREVLQLIAEGKTASQVAEIMVISTKTVEKHRSNLMAKLDVHDVAGLVRVAIKHRLVFVGE